MTQSEKEQAKRELWFWYFTQVLYNKKVISETKKEELEKLIGVSG